MIFPILKNEKMQNIQDNPIFLELYCLFIAILTAIFWAFNFTAGAVTFIVIAFAVLILFWDLKLVVPIMLNMMFLINKSFNFTVDNFPLLIAIIAPCFVGLLVLYIIFNKIDLKKGKSKLSLFIFAILAIIPIFWCIPLGDGQQFLKALYFNWLLYFVLYMVFLNGIKRDSMDVMLKSFTYLPLVLMVQTVTTTLKLPDWINNLKYFGCNLGWGIGNEAGIMLLFVLPFIYYRLVTGNKKVKALSITMIIFSLIATVFTFSRGGYLAIPGEIGILSILYIVYLGKFKKKDEQSSKHSLEMIIPIATIVILLGVGLGCGFGFGIIQKVFWDERPIASDSRFTILYPQAWNNFIKNPLCMILGNGFIARIDVRNRIIVYHSTFFETMSSMGIIGLITLGFHFYQKYKTPIKNWNLFACFTLVSYFVVDCYGMLDNTYHMYYYMIYLCVFLAIYERHLEINSTSISSENNLENCKKCEINVK